MPKSTVYGRSESDNQVFSGLDCRDQRPDPTMFMTRVKL